jgi:hypothetical protein
VDVLNRFNTPNHAVLRLGCETIRGLGTFRTLGRCPPMFYWSMLALLGTMVVIAIVNFLSG